MSGADVHRSVSVLRQTRLRQDQWNLPRAAAVQQSTAARLNSSHAQTESAGHCLQLRTVSAGVSSENDDNWRSGCREQDRRA